jgi:hypothetical protein
MLESMHDGCYACGSMLQPARSEMPCTLSAMLVSHGIVFAQPECAECTAPIKTSTHRRGAESVRVPSRQERPRFLCLSCYEQSDRDLRLLTFTASCARCDRTADLSHRVLVTLSDACVPHEPAARVRLRVLFVSCSPEHLALLIRALTSSREGWCSWCDVHHVPGETRIEAVRERAVPASWLSLRAWLVWARVVPRRERTTVAALIAPPTTA